MIIGINKTNSIKTYFNNSAGHNIKEPDTFARLLIAFTKSYFCTNNK